MAEQIGHVDDIADQIRNLVTNNKQERQSRTREDQPPQKTRKINPHTRRQDHQPQFAPRSGDIIIRNIPSLETNQVLSVKGIIKIYVDDEDFIYRADEKPRPKLIFHNGDLVLRFGRFTSKYFTWVYDENPTVYIYYKPDPLERDVSDSEPNSPNWWFKVAQKQNPLPYEPNPDQPIPGGIDQIKREYLELGLFRLDKGDFIIHRKPVPARDCPWGASYELRVVEADYETTNPVIWSRGTVCVRVRMPRPLSDEYFQMAKRLEVPYLMESLDVNLDESVPFYAYGFVCMGMQTTSRNEWNRNMDRYILTRYSEGTWRYLGYAHNTFTNMARRNEDNQGLVHYDFCPVRPGDLIVNLDERINPLAGVDSDNGHIMISRDIVNARERPEILPGTLIIRLGAFVDPEARESLFIHREQTLTAHNAGRDDYATWAEVITPMIYRRNYLAKNDWAESPIVFGTTLPEMPTQPGVPQHPSVPRGVGLSIPQHIFDHLNQPVAHELKLTERDLIFNDAASYNHLAMFSRDAAIIWRVFEDVRVDLALKWAVGPHPYALRLWRYLYLNSENEPSFHIFYYHEDYQPRDGDHLIRHNIEEDQENFPKRWIVTVEMYTWHKIPSKWKGQSTGFWVWRGRDSAVLPVQNYGPDEPRTMYDDDMDTG